MILDVMMGYWTLALWFGLRMIFSENLHRSREVRLWDLL